MPELVAHATGITDFKDGRSHARRGPGDGAQIVRGTASDGHRERRGWNIAQHGRVTPGLVLRHEDGRCAGAKGVERVVRAGNHIGQGEVAVGIRLHPELVGLHPLLKIIRAGGGGRLLNRAHPQAAGGGIRIAAVIDHELAGNGAATAGQGVIGIGEPVVGPGGLFGRALCEGIVVEGLGGEVGGRERISDVVAIDKVRPINLGPDFAVGKVAVRAHAVMPAVVHVQDGGADVLHQFTLERTAVAIFGAVGDVPQAHIFAGDAHAAPAPDVIHPEVGAVLVFILVLAGVHAIGPEGDLHWCTLHANGGAAGNLHHAIAGGIHAHPVEDRAGVNVVPGFTHAHGAVRAAMPPDGGNIKSGGPA